MASCLSPVADGTDPRREVGGDVTVDVLEVRRRSSEPISDVRLLHLLEVAGFPSLVEPGLQRRVQPQQHVPALPRNGLYPVVLLSCRSLRPEPHCHRTVRILLDGGLVAVDAGKLLVGLQHRACLVVINRERPELAGWDWTGQRDLVGLAAIKIVALRIPNRYCIGRPATWLGRGHRWRDAGRVVVKQVRASSIRSPWSSNA